MNWQLACLILYCAYASSESILSITLNKAEGQIYALSSDYWLYELDNVAVVQNNKHRLNSSAAPTYSSAFISTIGARKYLFQTISDFNNYGTVLAKFSLPFNNKPILTPVETTLDYGYTDVPTAFNARDSLALAISNGDFLNLFDLMLPNSTQTSRVIVGHKRAATAVLYNFNARRAVVFAYTFLQSSRKYNMQVLEFSVTKKSFTSIDTTFSTTAFNNSRATSAAFDSSTNSYWILDDQSKRLACFNANNLDNYWTINLGAISFELGSSITVYNFQSQLAYVLSYTTAGYKLQEVDIVVGNIRRSATYNTGSLPAATAFLDIEEGNLYVGLLDESTAPAKLSVVDLGNLHQQIITLNH